MNETSFILSLLMIYQTELYEQLAVSEDVPGVLLKGILYESSAFVRDIMERLTHFLAVNVRVAGSGIEKQPLFHLLSAFIDAKVWTKENTISSAYYEILIIMIEKFSKTEYKGKLLIDTNAKLREVLAYIKSYDSFEIADSENVDVTLLGLLQLANKLNLLNRYSTVFSNKELVELIDELFAGCLFPNEEGVYKCKTEKTREAAYKFIVSLVNYNIELWIHLLRNCILPLREKVNAPSTWGYNPANGRQSPLGYTGIKNLGFICYINSMMQQFFMISPFRNAMLSVCDGKEPTLAENGVDDNLVHQFQRLFAYLLRSRRKDFVPTAFCYSFKEVDGEPTNTAVQHDAFEFLNILFERLEKALEVTPYKCLMQSIFGGKTCSQVICSNCGYISSVYEDYYSLSLEIKNQNTLDEAMEKFISESSVSDYRCSHCQQKVDVGKRTVISTLPNILIVHLQRFAFNFDTLMNEKIHTKLEFPNVLDMVKYTEEGLGSGRKIKESLAEAKETADRNPSEIEGCEKELKEGALHKEEKPKKELKDKEYYLYKLVGVVMHNGNAESGHYYSYINTNRGPHEAEPNFLKTETDKWVEFNDSIIRDFAFSRIESECFGGTMEDIATDYMDDANEIVKLIGGRSKSAYMLFYERQYKSKIPLRLDSGEGVPADAGVLGALECDSAAVSRDAGQVFAKDAHNVYALHPFHQVPVHINSCLLLLVYEKEFMAFLYEVCSSAKISYACTSNMECKNTLRVLLYKLIDKFFFEAISHVSIPNSNPLSYLWFTAIEFFKSDRESSEELVEKFARDPTQFFDLLVKCPEPSIRSLAGKSVLGACTQLAKSPPESFPLLVNYMIGFLGYELATQWSKFTQFFDLLKDIVVAADEEFLLSLYERDLITSLLDFYLEKSSPVTKTNIRRYEMGSSMQMPNFVSLMKIVTFLTLRGDTVNKRGERIKSPYREGALDIKVSEDAMKCFACEELVPKYLKSSGRIEEILPMVKHVCFLNKKLTKAFCRAALIGINSNEMGKIPQYFDLIFGLLSIEDEFQTLRTELLLGYAQPVYKGGYGLCAVIDIEDDVNCYMSAAAEEGKGKAVLQALWSDRRRSEKLIVLCLKMLFNELRTNKTLHDHVKAMPPPCYLFESYLDWIPKFLQVYLKMSSYMTASELKERDESIEEVRKMYEEYKVRVCKEGVQPRQHYIIGKTLGTKEIAIVAEGQAKAVIAEITAEVYETKPMDSHNAALPGRYLIDHFNHVSNNVNMRYESKEEAKELGVESGNSVEQGGDAASMATSEPPNGKDENKKEEAKLESKKEVTGDSWDEVDAKKEEIKINVSEDSTSAAESFPKLTVPFTSVATFHKVDIINSGKDRVTAKVALEPKKNSALNFYCPIAIGACKAVYYSATAFTIQKDDITKDFGEYEMKVKFQVQPSANASAAYSQSSPIDDDATAGTFRTKLDGIPCPDCTFLNSKYAVYCGACNRRLS